MGNDSTPRHASDQDVTGIWNQFEQQNDSKTFYSGPLSWLNNLVASTERAGKAITGDNSPNEWWGCADSAPALQNEMNQKLQGSDQVAEVMTTRNWLGLQHNQTVTHNANGDLSNARVFDDWAGKEEKLPKSYDHTLLPIGQLLEGMAGLLTGSGFGESIEGTGIGANKKVTGNESLDFTGPLFRGWDKLKGLF